MATNEEGGAGEVPTGYVWPSEWEPHRATWMAWPHNPNTWPGKFSRIPPKYACLVRAISEVEPVELLVPPEDRLKPGDRGLLGELARRPNVTLHAIPTNDSWIRDYGPTFLTAQRGAESESAGPNAIAGIDWSFNAWGEKYSPYIDDQRAARAILDLRQADRIVAPMTLEGGAIDGNGAGWLLTTRSCALHPRRNPAWTQRQAERVFADLLGAQEVIWLAGDGLSGDDTDGHIDQLARFVDRSTVVVAVSRNRRDENAEPLARNAQALRDWRSRQGDALDVVELPTPRRRWCQGRRLPCSYCNFIFVHRGVIVPTFGDPMDQVAVDTIQSLFPDREVTPVDALDLIWGLGAFHCLTQQEPDGFGYARRGPYVA